MVALASGAENMKIGADMMIQGSEMMQGSD